MKIITVYTKPDCPYCVKAKSLIESKGDTVSELVIGRDVNRTMFLEQYPDVKTVPYIRHGGKSIGGYEDLEVYYLSV